MTAIEIIRQLTIVVFVALGVVAVVRWRRGGGAAAGWLALSFGLLALVPLALALLPNEEQGPVLEGVRRLVLVALVSFPYLLFRFTTSLERPARRSVVVAASLTAVTAALTLALPIRLGDEDARGAAFTVFLVSVGVQWLTITAMVAVRLWRSGGRRPTVARRRMRTLSLGSLGITLALLLSGGAADDDALGVVIRVLGLLSAILFFVGFAPPAPLRTAWRRTEQATLERAAAQLVGARTVDEVTGIVLPFAATIVGADGSALVADDGEVLGVQGVSEDAVAAGAPLGMGLRSGRLLLWTDPYTPFFGRDELRLLRSLGDLADLAFDRCELQRREGVARAELQRQVSFTDRLIDSSSDGILAFDHELRYTLWSKGMERISGMEEEQTLGRRATEVFPFLRDIGEDRCFYEALEGHDVTSTDRRFVVPETGREGYFDSRYSPLYDDAGQIVGGLSIVRDVTERKRVEREREITETLQRSLLPDRLSGLPGVEAAGRYLPGGTGRVGGDWYDVIPLPDGRLGLTIGDVVGHGLAAATLMSQLRTAMRAYAHEHMAPAVVMTSLAGIIGRLESGGMATVLYLVLEPETGVLRYTSAGHLPALLFGPAGEAVFLEEALGVPLGAQDHDTYRYREATVTLGASAGLVLYTDGLVEQRSVGIDERLEQLRGAAAGGPREPERLCAHLVATMLPGPAADDVALMAVRRDEEAPGQGR